MKNTPIGELIEFMELNYGHINHDDVICKAYELIEKEKSLIIDAHEAGQILIVTTFIEEMKERGLEMPNTILEITKVEEGDVDEESQKYYNNKFNK